jgi:ankyrin repeat protein
MVREWMLTPQTLETRDGLGNSVLHYAAQWRLDPHIPLLVQKGANPDAVNATGETPLFMAVKIDSPSTITVLLQAGSSIAWRDSLGNTVLHAAVRWDAPRAAEALIAEGIDLDVHALNGKTPLHDAVRLGIIDVENVLVKAGVNFEVRDNDGNTPFMEAVMAGNSGVIERLANLGADPMIRNGRGDTPLHVAVNMERSDLVNLLLSWGVSIHAKNAVGRTPFQISLSTSPRMVSTLLTKERILSSDDEGRAPLHIAILNEAPLDMVKAILDQGGRIQAVDAAGRTPLRMAADMNNWEAAKFLADSGSDPFSTAGDGKTPAAIAIAGGIDPVKAVFSGLAIGAKDVGGNTILHYAAQTGSTQLIALLLNLGASKDSRNFTAERPVDVAIRWNRSDIAALLNS